MQDVAYAGSRFYVELEGKKLGVFTEVSGLQTEINVTEYEEGGNNGFTYHDGLQNIHGPYTSYDFHSPQNDPFVLLPDKKRTTTSVPSHSGLVAASMRSPWLNTGPCPA